jgi:hypothetical protein
MHIHILCTVFSLPQKHEYDYSHIYLNILNLKKYCLPHIAHRVGYYGVLLWEIWGIK